MFKKLASNAAPNAISSTLQRARRQYGDIDNIGKGIKHVTGNAPNYGSVKGDLGLSGTVKTAKGKYASEGHIKYLRDMGASEEQIAEAIRRANKL